MVKLVQNAKVSLIVPPGVSPQGISFRPHPPIGLAYIAAELLDAGYKVHLLDARAEGYSKWQEIREKKIRLTGLPISQIITRLNEEDPDVIGIHFGMISDHYSVSELVNSIRDSTSTPIILGGPGASSLSREILGDTNYPVEKIDGVDFVITGRGIGAGGKSTVQLIKKLQTGDKNFQNIRGIAFRRNGRVIETENAEVNLKKLKIPARHLYVRKDGMDIYSYINNPHSGPIDNIPFSVLMTQRNCNFNCSFCSTPNGWERRELLDIKKELYLLKYDGIRTIQIEDDNFGGHTSQHLKDACKIVGMIAEIGFSELDFPNGVTIKSLCDSNYALLEKLGNLAKNGKKIRISLPLESGNNNTLKKLIRKPHFAKMIKKLLKKIKKEDLIDNPHFVLEAFFMVGVVDEYGNREPINSINDTFRFAEWIGREYGIDINLWICKPNPPKPQYRVWRRKNPNKGFERLMFAEPSGIWGNENEERSLLNRVKEFNNYALEEGFGSKRAIFHG